MEIILFLGDGSLASEGTSKKHVAQNLLVAKNWPISFGSGAFEKQPNFCDLVSERFVKFIVDNWKDSASNHINVTAARK
jgi:hypothetical protein